MHLFLVSCHWLPLFNHVLQESVACSAEEYRMGRWTIGCNHVFKEHVACSAEDYRMGR